MPRRGSMLLVSSVRATTSSASGSIGTPSTLVGGAAVPRPGGTVTARTRVVHRMARRRCLIAALSYAVQIGTWEATIGPPTPPRSEPPAKPWRSSTTVSGRMDMAHTKSSKSAAVRARLDHPVIDGDGHWLEPIPIFLDYLKDVAGASVVDKFVKRAKDTTWYDIAPEERMRRRLHRPTWWGEPANTLDRATAMIPRLFYERLDDFGIDFCVLYTSLGLFFVSNPDEEIRRGVSRAVNKMNADLFKPYRHRITPAAVVPVHTPQEAIEEATYAIRELGLKVVMIANHVRRPVPAFMREGAPLNEVRTYVDSLGFESAYDS